MRVKTLVLKSEEAEAVAQALDMRINWIETGNVLLSRNDAIQLNASVVVDAGAHRISHPETTAKLVKIKMLEPDQVKLVAMLVRLRDQLQGA